MRSLLCFVGYVLAGLPVLLLVLMTFGAMHHKVVHWIEQFEGATVATCFCVVIMVGVMLASVFAPD